MIRQLARSFFALMLGLICMEPGRADDAADFYSGRNFKLDRGLQCRRRRRPLCANDRPASGKHLPGQPNIIVHKRQAPAAWRRPITSSMSLHATARRSACSPAISPSIRSSVACGRSMTPDDPIGSARPPRDRGMSFGKVVVVQDVRRRSGARDGHGRRGYQHRGFSDRVKQPDWVEVQTCERL